MLTYSATRSRTTAIVCAAFAAALLAGCSSSGGAQPQASSSSTNTPTKSHYKIGSITSLTGAGAVNGVTAAAGIKAWVASVNASGGINGHPVDLVLKDDGSDAARGLAAVKSLVEDEHVIALVGVHGNTSESSWASYVQSKQIPVVGGESDTPNWLSNPYFFVSGEPGVDVISTEAYLASKLGKTKFGTINVQLGDVAPLLAFLKSAAASYKLDYVFHSFVSPSSPNYTADCISAKQAGAEIIPLNLDPNTLTRVVNDCSRQNYKPTYIIPSGAFESSSLSNPNFNGTYVPNNNFLWFADTPAAQAYRDAMNKYAPGAKQDPNSVQTWSGGILFQAAAQNLGDNPTPADVLAGLYALPPNDTLGGVSTGATFTKGKPVQAKPCFFLAQIQDGKLTAPEGLDPICPPSA